MPEAPETSAESTWLLPPGTRVDHFQVLRPLGSGGMAEVYLARDQKLGRKVALKLLRPGVLGEDEARQFLFEARATARCMHPHIVTVFAVGEHQGRAYVALEHLDGESLRERMSREGLSATQVMRVGLAIAEALTEAHGHGIVHRDLKPENVMMARDGRARVVDFGLARPLGRIPREAAPAPTGRGAAASTDLLTAEEVARSPRGTPDYMAPEQWAGTEESGATDVWALGVTLYELLAGVRPFSGETFVQLALKVSADTPAPDLPAGLVVPEGLAHLIQRCLTKPPEGRPAAREVAAQLRRMLEARDRAASQDESPFMGLLPFGEHHHHLFFGRDAEIGAVVERLREETLLPILGPSGAGKSSFVQAGLIPRLREHGPLLVVQLRPGRDPFTALASRVVAARKPATSPGRSDGPFGVPTPDSLAAPIEAGQGPEEVAHLARQLRGAPHLLNLLLHRLADRRRSNVLLFVDQLEELCALVEDETERGAFMQALCTAADDPQLPVRVVLTLREEFLSRVATGPGVREALSRVVLLRSPAAVALKEILRRPVEAVGYRYDDPSLVDEMAREVAAEVACLPLLQFAGQQLWEGRDRDRRLLLRDTYRAIGGVAGALAQHADSVLAGLTAEELEEARRILLRLVTPDGTRRSLARPRLLEGLGARAEEVLKLLVAARLVTGHQADTAGAAAGEGEYELAHESLLVSFRRLQRWIEESREEIVFLSEVGQAADLWARRGQRDDEVWTGRALLDARRAASHCTTRIPERVRAFLAAGERKELRRVRRKRGVLGLVMALLCGAALVFFWKEREATQQRNAAVLAEQRARSSEAQAHNAAREARYSLATTLAEKARQASTAHEALLYAAGALEQAEHPAARGVLAGAIRDSRPVIRWQTTKGATCSAMMLDERRQRLLGVDDTVGLLMWDLGSGAEIDRPDSPGDQTTSLAMTPDGNELVTATTSGTVVIRTADSLTAVRRIEPATGTGGWALLSADGETLVFVGVKGQARSYRYRSGEVIGERDLGCQRVTAVALAPDGLAAVGCKGGRVTLWRPGDSGAPLQSDAHQAGITGLAFSSDGRTLAVSDLRGNLGIFQVADLRPTARATGPEWDAAYWLSFLPGDQILARGGGDGLIRFLDVDSLREARPPLRHGGFVTAATISATGERLVSSGADGNVRLWDLPGRRELARVTGHRWGQQQLRRAPDGSSLLDLAYSGAIHLRRWQDGVALAELSGPQAFFRAEFTPAGDRVVAMAFHEVDDAEVVNSLWSYATSGGVHLARHTLPKDLPVTVFAVAPSGDEIVRLTAGGDLCLFGLDDDRCAFTFARGLQSLWVVEVSAAHDLLAFPGHDNVIEVWDLRQRRRRWQLSGHQSEPRVLAFSADGAALASGDRTGQIRLWDLSRGRERRVIAAHQSQVRDLDFSPDGRWLASGSYDKSIAIWDTATALPLERWTYGDLVWTVLFSPDGRALAAAGMDGVVRLWDLDLAAKRAEPGRFDSPVIQLGYIEGGDQLCGANASGTVRCFDPRSLEPRSTRQLPAEQQQLLGISPEGGKLLAFSTRAQGLLALDLTQDSPPAAVLAGASEPYTLAVVSPAQRALVACTFLRDTRVVRVSDALNGTPEPLKTIQDSVDGGCRAAAFSADDRLLALLGDVGNNVEVWDVARQQRLGAYAGGPCALYAVALSPDGARVAAAGCGKVVRVWDVASRVQEQVLSGHDGWISALAFSPDGARLVSADIHASARIWDVASGRELARLDGLAPCGWGKNTLAFAPDGKTLATAQQDGSIKLWDLEVLTVDPEALYAQVSRESSMILDGAQIVSDPERLKTHFEILVPPQGASAPALSSR